MLLGIFQFYETIVWIKMLKNISIIIIIIIIITITVTIIARYQYCFDK
jgi:hypothetical protein